jgi:hypothetical protein
VDEMQVDVQNRLFSRLGMDDVIVPNFFKHRPGLGRLSHVNVLFKKGGGKKFPETNPPNGGAIRFQTHFIILNLLNLCRFNIADGKKLFWRGVGYASDG